MCIYIHTHVCMCVCERERGRERGLYNLKKVRYKYRPLLNVNFIDRPIQYDSDTSNNRVVEYNLVS